MNTSTIFREGVLFSSSRYFLLGLSFLRNFVLAKFLGPENYGIWIVISLLLTYADQIHLGLRHAGDRELPFLMGQGDYERSAATANAIFGGIVALTLVGAFLLLLTHSFLGDGFYLSQYALSLVVAIFASDQINRYYLMILRTQREFIFSSKVELAFEVLRTVAVVSLVIVFNIIGALYGLFISSFASAVFFFKRFRFRFVPSFDIGGFWSLLQKGFPFFVSGVLYLTFLNIDRVVASFVFTKDNLGQYGFAALVAQLPISGALALAMVLYPRFSSSIGESGSVKKLYDLYAKSISILSYLSPLVVAVMIISSEVLILLLLPEYVDSFFYLKLLFFGIFPIALIPLPLFLLMSTGRSSEYLWIQTFGVVLSLLFYGISLQIWNPQWAIPYAVITSYSVFLLLLLNRAFSIFSMKKKIHFVRLMYTLIPVIISVCVLYFVEYHFAIESELMQKEIWSSITKLMAFVFFYSPILLLLWFRSAVMGGDG